jgi:hypothetical protein
MDLSGKFGENDNTLRDVSERTPVSSPAKATMSQQANGLTLGGSIESPAYCLLVGINETGGNEYQRVQVPITKLPAILGREHATMDDNTNFYALGKAMALSREHVRIEYRIPTGVLKTNDGKFVYEAGKKLTKKSIVNKLPLSSTGSFTLTTLGKNKVRVNREFVEQGETAVLEANSTIQMSTFKLYFLLPEEESTKTMQVQIDTKKKRKAATASHQPEKKAKVSSASLDGRCWPTKFQQELEKMDTDTLLNEFQLCVAKDEWTRRHHCMGAQIAYRACIECAQDPVMQVQAEENGGLGRNEMMEWIAASERYREWVRQMLVKIEDKSYQGAITKALQKAGYERMPTPTGSVRGRYIKWRLPTNLEGERGSSKAQNDGDDDNDEGDKESASDGESDRSEQGGTGDNAEEDEGSDQDDE